MEGTCKHADAPGQQSWRYHDLYTIMQVHSYFTSLKNKIWPITVKKYR